MLHGEALGTIPIKIGNLTRIPPAATITPHWDGHTAQHNVAENEKRVHKYLMGTKLSLFADDISKSRENAKKFNRKSLSSNVILERECLASFGLLQKNTPD